MKDGKLFGKINIIDLLVVLIALATVVMVALKMTGRLGGLKNEVTTNVVYTARVERVDRDIYEAVTAFIDEAKAAGKPGDQLMANGELLSGYITGVTAVPHEQITLHSYDASISVESGEDTLDLLFTIEAYGVNNIKTNVGTQEVRVGKGHIIKTTHFEFANGVVVTCEWANGTAAD